MNVGSLSLLKINTMKASIMIKVFLVLPLIFLIDYVLMVFLGCSTCLFGFGKDFYCGGYCLIGKIILGFSGALFIFIIFPDIQKIFKRKVNA
jgi:hypothetical protein